MTRQKIYIYL